MGPPGLKEANRASEGESLAWVEGEKDSERIVTIFCIILSDVEHSNKFLSACRTF